MFLSINYYSEIFRPQFLAISKKLPQEGQEMKPKNVGAVIIEWKHCEKKLVLSLIYAVYLHGKCTILNNVVQV